MGLQLLPDRREKQSKAPASKAHSLGRVRFLHSQSNLIKNLQVSKEQEAHCFRISTGVHQGWPNPPQRRRGAVCRVVLSDFWEASADRRSTIPGLGVVEGGGVFWERSKGYRSQGLGLAQSHAKVIKSLF